MSPLAKAEFFLASTLSMNNNGTTIKSHRGIMYNVFSLLNTWKKAIKKQEEKKNTKFPTFYNLQF